MDMQASINLRKLPDWCYAQLPTSKSMLIIKAGEAGYSSSVIKNAAPFPPDGMSLTDYIVQENEKIGVTIQQQLAMSAGCAFGWGVPSADPDNYDSKGNIIV